MGLFLFAYSQVIYVEEIVADENETCKEGLKVEVLDAMTIACFLVALVFNVVGSFTKDSSRQSIRRLIKRTVSSISSGAAVDCRKEHSPAPQAQVSASSRTRT